MNSLEIAIRLLAGLALILANGFFVAIEFALTRVRQYSESEFDTPALRRAWEMTDDLEIYLTSCQVGITGSSIAVGIVAEPALGAIFEPYFHNTALASLGAGGLLAFLIINLVHLTHGEQTPTYLGVERTKFVCKWGARPLYWFAWVISPIISVGDTVAKATLKLFGVEMTGAWLEAEEDVIENRAQLRNRLNFLLEQGDLSEERHEEVINALTVDEIMVGDVMVDIDDAVVLSTADPIEENLERVYDSPHTRYPLVGSDLDDYRGVVYVPSLLEHLDEIRAGELDLADVAAPPMTVAVDTSVSGVIDQFQAEGQELALAMAEGEVQGLLTATDALETVMGDIEDPLDRDAMS